MKSVPALFWEVESVGLPRVPPAVLLMVVRWLEPLLGWVSALLYERVVQQCRAHPLVQLARVYDPSPVIARCAAYQKAGGRGAPATYTVAQLVRAELVRVWAGSCSDPALERLLAADLIVRWYVGLPLGGPTPDHSTLQRFHVWLSEHQPRALFDEGLAFLDQVDPEPVAQTPQIADTFALASPVAPMHTTDLLVALTAQSVTLWAELAPLALRETVLRLPPTAFELPLPQRTPGQRLARLRHAAPLAEQVLSTLRPHLAALPETDRVRLAQQLGYVEKVLADEVTTDEEGLFIPRPAATRGSYRLASAVDVEATFRLHEPHPAVLGYNAALATTATRIRAAVVVTGATPDSEAPALLLRQQQAAGSPLPPQLIMDAAAGWGKTRAEVQGLSRGQTTIVAPIPQAGGADLSRFTPADFFYDAQSARCTCPNGVTSTRAYQHGAGDGLSFRFLAAECAGCPLWERCRAADASPKGHRSVYVTPYHATLRRAALLNQSQEGRALLATRWQVEPTVAWLVRYDGARRARRVGLAAAQFHLFQACALRTLWRWLARLQRGQAPQVEQLLPVAA